MNFWRGLRGVGRWGHADPSLLEGLDVDLFEYADAQFQQAYNASAKMINMQAEILDVIINRLVR